MLFNSLHFALFLPIVLALYYLLRQRHEAQNRLLMVASLYFYASWDWRFLGLLFLTMIVDFNVAAWLERMHEAGAPQARRKRVLAISMASNLAILGFFKYCNFFIDSLQSFAASLGLHPSLHTLGIVLPIGISFFTFQSMSYTIDVYRGELKAARNFWDFALFVSFFPHLVAGPIMRAVVLLPQVLRPRQTTRQQVNEGIHLIVWGLWKKCFIADNLAPLVDATFNAPHSSGFEVLLAVYAFAFQIYCDFSGYTDIARGVAKLFGFELGLNFNLPYFAQSPQEFWSRWHISLSSWLRNYLYFPLGGNRQGKWQTYRNLMLTMALGGLWHGAAWNFVLWGLYQGTLLAVHRLYRDFVPGKPAVENDTRPLAWLKMIVMFQFTCYGWLLFRAKSLSQVASMTGALTHPFDTFSWDQITPLVPYIAPLLAVQIYQYVSRNHYFLAARFLPRPLRTACYAALSYVILFHAAAPQAFIYFQF